MYDLIYQFILDNLFNSTSLDAYETSILGVTTNMNVWLAHSFTIATMIIIFVVLVLFTRWLFRLCSGLFLLR